MISSDNATRWNSTFVMINDALNLREAIDLYVNISLTGKSMEKKDKKKLERCYLGEEEWEELHHLHGLLYGFWELTLKMQGNVIQQGDDIQEQKIYGKQNEPVNGKSTSNAKNLEDGALFNVLPAFDNILSMLEDAKVTYAKNVNFTAGIHLAWKKLADYYEESDISKVYLVAAVLDPRIKMRYFEKNWEKDWLVGAQVKLDAYLEEFTIAMNIDIRNVENERDDLTDNSQQSYKKFGSWRQADDEAIGGTQTEWAKYLESGRVKDYPGFSVGHWWVSHQDEYPLLSNIALETLAIPAMSTEVERVFSGYIIPFQ